MKARLVWLILARSSGSGPSCAYGESQWARCFVQASAQAERLEAEPASRFSCA
jgi:hypothetical protein